MNYNAEILKGIGYLIGAILQISFPYIVAAVLGYQIAKRVRQRIRQSPNGSGSLVQRVKTTDQSVSSPGEKFWKSVFLPYRKTQNRANL